MGTRRSRTVRLTAAVATVGLGLAGCSSPGEPGADSGSGFLGLRSTGAPTLLQAGRSCDDVAEEFQRLAPAVLGSSFGGFDIAVMERGGALGAPDMATDDMATEMVADDSAEMSFDGDASFAPTAGAVSAAPQATTAAEEPAGVGGTSSTNTQEDGIDEPDVVETDGDYVYVVDDDHLVILDGDTASVVSRTPLSSYGAQLLLQGDRLLVIAGGGFGYPVGGPGIAIDGPAIDGPAIDGPAVDVPAVSFEARGDEDTGGAIGEDAPPPTAVTTTSTAPTPEDPTPGDPAPDVIEPAPPIGIEPVPVPLPEPLPVDPTDPIPVEPPVFGAQTIIQLFDVSDRTAPVLVETTEIEGNHVTTRVVGGVARVVVSSYPELSGVDIDPAVMERAFEADTAAEATEVVAGAVADAVDETEAADWLPRFRTTTRAAEPGGAGAPTTEEGSVVACDDVLIPEVNAGLVETSVLRVTFDEGFDADATTTVVAEAGAVYASPSRLYLAATRWVTPDQRGAVAAEEFSTAVHAFDLDVAGGATHVGAGEVPGSVLNQYSLSEYDGDLRIATTEGTPWGGGAESQSGVRVLRIADGELSEIGAVTGLGLTETIQSVRFMGPVGYVVTFRQTDPLYVIDLSDPTAPEAVGELKIPGFSSYLHPIGNGRLVGIGRDADLDGRDRGVLVSLFDVSDPTAPAQLHTWTRANAHSTAGNDAKAFLWWAPETAAVVPLEQWGGDVFVDDVVIEEPREVLVDPDTGVSTDGEIGIVAEPGAVTSPARDVVPTEQFLGFVVLDIDDDGINERDVVTVDGQYPNRALVVQDRLWSLFGDGVAVSAFDDPSAATFHTFG